jgi:putative ABC transport system ATP-binding protein
MIEMANIPDVPPDAAVAAVGLTKVYGDGATSVVALDGVAVTLARGQFTAIMGPSGSGKSTLLHCLAGLDTPTSGTVVIAGAELTGMTDDQRTRLRRDHIGFVFQAFNLVPTLTMLENITLPVRIAGRTPDQALLDAVVDTLGLANRLDHTPAQLSGGQQQRAACARALVSSPAVVFADEPTGTWTQAPARTCWRSSAGRWTRSARRSRWSPTTRWRRPTPTASCSSPTAASSTSWRGRPPSGCSSG